MKPGLQALHHKIYKRLKKSVEDIEEVTSEEIVEYRKSFEKFCKTEFEISHSNELLSSVKRSQIIYIGDFHTFDQNSKNMERILKFLIEEESKPILAMEMISFRHQAYIDAYLEGNLTEMELLESIEYHQSWRFPWVHYKYFFKMAKNKGLKIIGLNSEGSLSARDSFSSAILARLINEQNEKIVVLFGELHIIPEKIPALVNQQFPLQVVQDTIIHQNIDEIYWSAPDAKIVKLGDRVFSIQASPPWTKYDSQLYWYDHLEDDPEFDIHEYSRELSLKRLSEYSIDTFTGICNNSRDHLGFSKEDMELSSSFTLVDMSKLEWFDNKLNMLYDEKIYKFWRKLIEGNQLLRIPNSSYLYAPSYSLNRLAYLSGMHLFGHLFKKYINKNDNILQASEEDIFVYFFHQSLWGYLCSKIYNPFRKCDLYLDLKKKINKKEGKYKSIGLALKILDSPDCISKIILNKSTDQIFNSSKVLGHLLADSLFRFLYSKQQVHEFSLLAWNFSATWLDIEIIKDILHGQIHIKKEKKRIF